MVAHEARLRELDKNGNSVREHFQKAIDMGREEYVAKLEGPPFPDALTYLYGWLLELDSARDVGMNGLKPFTYQQIDAWSRMTDRHPEPHEVAALLYLGRVFLYPPPDED